MPQEKTAKVNNSSDPASASAEVLISENAGQPANDAHSKPLELNLFERLFLTEGDNEGEFSNMVELYDFIPKYIQRDAAGNADSTADSMAREFGCRGTRYQLIIHPAQITDQNGKQNSLYPTEREELVEDALRRLAATGSGVFLDGQAGVVFTILQLQAELTHTAHSYPVDELKEALLVCAQARITITTESGEVITDSNLFETLRLEESNDKTENEQQVFVGFNSLVTKSIIDCTFRRLNYEKSMSYKSALARRLHKRLSHHYVQPGMGNPYLLRLSTMINDFGLNSSAERADNLRDVQTALSEMIEKKVILSYEAEEITSDSGDGKLLDAKFVLVPAPELTNELIEANKLQAKIRSIEF